MTSLSFTNVAIVDVAVGLTRPHQTVVVRGDRITAVGPTDEIAPPADALVIDATGKTMIPGLCDMHVHIVPTGPGPGVDEVEAIRRARQYLLVFLTSGVTTIRNMAGTPLHLRLRDEVATGAALGPRILTCGPVLETRFTFPELQEFGQLVRTIEEARAEVRRQKQAGFDYIKVYNDIDAPIYDAIIREARNVGIPVVGHVAFQKGLDGALAAKQDSIEHLRSYDFAVDTRPPEVPRARFEGWLYATPHRIAELAERTAAAGVWNAPTLVIERSLRSDAEMNGPAPILPEDLPAWLKGELEASDMEPILTSAQRDALARGRGARGAMVKALDDIGAGVMAGSDCPGCRLVPGRSLLRELELYVEAGLSPLRALSTATTNAARFLGEPHEGVIATGRRADMVLLDGDPLTDFGALSRQHGVVVRGRWFSSTELRQLLMSA